VTDQEVTVAEDRQATMVDELRKAEVVRDRLEGLDQIARSYPEGHNMRVLIENLHLDRALRAVEEDIESLRDALLHPGGT
jgi:uridylate kinase